MASYQRLNDDIVCIDTQQQRASFAACYLIGGDGHYAFIEAGTSRSVPALLQVLDELHIDRDAIDYVMPTHVHLDHAGGAGALLRELPKARLVVHPRGARHLIDPSKLIASAVKVYGFEEVHRSYGDIVPVPESRVMVADVTRDDGFSLSVGRRPLLLVDVPGHARHHYAVWDARSRGWFSGDILGASYRDFDSALGFYVVPTTTPTQFDPVAWEDSLQKLMAKEPAHIYLTHYGRLDDAAGIVRQLRASLAAYQRIARAADGAADRHARLVAELFDYHLMQLRSMHHPMPEARVRALLKLDMELNAQGLEVWLDRSRRAH
ncbi:MAG TPA: MBL fold metallo-hydrolase [Nevskiaceae bacterium]